MSYISDNIDHPDRPRGDRDINAVAERPEQDVQRSVSRTNKLQGFHFNNACHLTANVPSRRTHPMSPMTCLVPSVFLDNGARVRFVGFPRASLRITHCSSRDGLPANTEQGLRALDGLRTTHVAHWPIFHVVIRSSSKASAVRRFVVASVMTFLRPVGRSARAEPVAKCRGRTTLAPVPDDDGRISEYDALMIAGLGTYTCAA
ncbi:hypothetical protein K466DRAFT_109982 [Polyporus arcularius HHB13444]|uniref:Uncharacterized protein n=1 Tax=Polyporus arcularius HHB13444 TaxID=1314778 RepID=A0A5C3PVA3_9APHY|nr:hypothetical protein K466DRAFT_109982 [Polyporus arcularius HHB13444]